MIYEIVFTCLAPICLSNSEMQKHKGDLFLNQQSCEVIAAAISTTPGTKAECVDHNGVAIIGFKDNGEAYWIRKPH